MRFLLNCLLRRAFNIYQCLPSIFYSLAQHMKLHRYYSKNSRERAKPVSQYRCLLHRALQLPLTPCCQLGSSFSFNLRLVQSSLLFTGVLKRGERDRGKRVKSKEHGTGGHSGVLHAWGQDPLFYTLLFMSVIFSNSDHPLTIRTSQHTAKSNRA